FLSIFPVRWLYVFSSLLYPIIYYIIPYRKKLVFKNLQNSFPEKPKSEIRKIAKEFYHHLCDSFVESVVESTLSKQELLKRFKVKNPEVCNNLYQEGKSISLLMAHYGNWEWSSIMPEYIRHKVLAIYKPLRNKYFDRYIKKSRERFGVRTVAMEKILRVLTEYKNQSIPTLTYFIADQRPRWAQIQHWIKFLNQDTPVILGAEKISKKLNHAVVFLDIRKTGRGYYEVEFKLLYEDPGQTDIFEITEKYYEILEERIKKEPEFWLWTHKRWKHEIEKFVPKAHTH
ncbi:MAG: lysophospholipid acyltransferase family protein, partial [Bacteroidales bacterium]